MENDEGGGRTHLRDGTEAGVVAVSVLVVGVYSVGTALCLLVPVVPAFAVPVAGGREKRRVVVRARRMGRPTTGATP